MLIPLERRVDEPEFRRLLLKHFPQVGEEIAGDEGLVHLEMGALRRIADKAIAAGDFESLRDAYEFVGDLARHSSELDPNVLNAIHVSFLEHLDFENKQHGTKAKKMLPGVLLQMYEAQWAHNRQVINLAKRAD